MPVLAEIWSMSAGNKTKFGIGMFAFSVAASLVANRIGLIDLGNIVKSVASVVRYVMSIEIPVWVIPLVTFPLFAAVSALAFIVVRNRPPDPPNDPEWLDFTMLRYNGRLFGWDYSHDDDTEPVNFRELCPECEYELDGNDCPKCGRSRPFVFRGQAFGITHPIPGAVPRLVRGHIKSGAYKDIMADDPKN